MSLDIWEQAARVFDTADTFGLLGFVPNPGPQTRFLSLPDLNLDVLYGGAAGGSKELRVDEPIPTPSGWTTMGELRPGDRVFDDRGQPCTVTATHPVDLEPTAYRLTFDDGTCIEADADHEWLTFDGAELGALTRLDDDGWRARRRAKRPSRATGRRSELFTASVTARNQAAPPPTKPPPAGTIRTTKEIAETLLTPRGRRNHAVLVAGPLALPAADLPLDPYVLGAWLGDGTTASAGFTSADEEIVAEIRAAGVPVQDVRGEGKPYAWRLGVTEHGVRSNGAAGLVNTVRVLLSALGVLGDKHIPIAYLRASVDQRLALLQGLMDTDGTVNKFGQVSFGTTCSRLADGFHELVSSLGWKVRRVERRAKLYGRDCGPQWAFKWTPDQLVFRLPRKAERQVLASRRTTRFRYIVACDRVPASPMRCISVDSPSRLFLAGRSMVPTHNSTSLLMYGLRSCHRFPGLQTFWFRRTFPELEHSVLRMLQRYGYAKALGAAWNGSKYELRLQNGSTLTFCHAKSVDEASALLSAEINLLLLDERTTFPPDVVDLLYSRVRSGVKGVPCLGIRSGTNPGSIGHSRVKTEYVEATDHGTHDVDPDRLGRRRIFIQAKLSDTPQLGEDYRQGLAGLDEKLAKAYLEGDWDTFQGMCFQEWRYDRHVVEPFSLPKEWRRYVGVDWGYTAPWAVLWAAVDEDDRVWVYREIYRTQVGEAEQARQILAAEAGETVVARYADDAMWATRGDAKAISAVYAENGVHLTPAGKGPGSRIAGWQRIHSYLAEGPACPHHRALGWETCPRLHAFSSVTELIRTLPALPHATVGDPEDVDQNAEDHSGDGLRYLLVNIGTGPSFPILPPRGSPNPFALTVAPAGTYAVRVEVAPVVAPSAVWGVAEDAPVRGGVKTYDF